MTATLSALLDTFETTLSHKSFIGSDVRSTMVMALKEVHRGLKGLRRIKGLWFWGDFEISNYHAGDYNILVDK